MRLVRRLMIIQAIKQDGGGGGGGAKRNGQTRYNNLKVEPTGHTKSLEVAYETKT